MAGLELPHSALSLDRPKKAHPNQHGGRIAWPPVINATVWKQAPQMLVGVALPVNKTTAVSFQPFIFFSCQGETNLGSNAPSLRCSRIFLSGRRSLCVQT